MFWKTHFVPSIISISIALYVDVKYILTSDKINDNGIVDLLMMGILISVTPIVLTRMAILYIYRDCKEKDDQFGNLIVDLSHAMILMDIVFCVVVVLVPLADIANAFHFETSDMIMLWPFIYITLFIPLTLVVHIIRWIIKNRDVNSQDLNYYYQPV